MGSKAAQRPGDQVAVEAPASGGQRAGRAPELEAVAGTRRRGPQHELVGSRAQLAPAHARVALEPPCGEHRPRGGDRELGRGRSGDTAAVPHEGEAVDAGHQLRHRAADHLPAPVEVVGDVDLIAVTEAVDPGDLLAQLDPERADPFQARRKPLGERRPKLGIAVGVLALEGLERRGCPDVPAGEGRGPARLERLLDHRHAETGLAAYAAAVMPGHPGADDQHVHLAAQESHGITSRR